MWANPQETADFVIFTEESLMENFIFYAVRQIIYSLYQVKEITKVYNNIMNSIKLENPIDTISRNSKNSGTFDPHRLLLNLASKIKLRRSDKYVDLSNLSIYYTGKNIKKSYKNNKSKILAPTWTEDFNYLMDHILYQIFKIILNISLKKHRENTDNPSIRIYVNRM